ncbi:hypothetical protein DE4585_03769 [Mycobacteroides salmoniphilum]|uniref:Uncharacterized protein n=1 Tax=Mycobacteroides salmoniphilum TaxID=404941 RepID=A0A4R8SAS1_9MYCO|nr:hypothetical protein [Mycobacteroides salmoniphilum]TDZ78866.1 hypothetical protein DE4586_02028 [Mycobacteroides salmoniphilum]TDZ80020.1 hypothetical protein DE4585_03769 [Mycobacteroides salmoniphilum]TDZ86443.1 hypothetical protein DE4587_02408 [Mycobacteroides salmoniphilum]TDZ91556.1 hypothetical protein CCUG60885_04452 [Mycobacteroides salmoniphilum]TEA08810.1 hypothetical protein CCUG60883_00487 [Mycobacteroides salmoniphilum]
MRPLLRGLGAAGAAAVTLALPAAPASAAELHNISYIARVDGLGRGISVTFKTDPVDRRTEQPRLGPGESWEVNLVMEDPAQAGMSVRVLPPYGVGLHCEVQVDDVVVDSQDLTVPPALGIFNGPVNDSVTCGHFNS